MQGDARGCKWMQMDASGYKWMQMVAIGCRQIYSLSELDIDRKVNQENQ